MEPVHSQPRRIRSDRGLSQWGGLYPFWKLVTTTWWMVKSRGDESTRV